MINIKTIKNLYKNEIQSFLKTLGYKNVSKLTSGKDIYDYSTINHFLESEIAKKHGNLNNKNLDEFLYKKLFFDKNNYHYIYNLSSFFSKSTDIEYSSIETHLRDPALKFNMSIADAFPSKPLDLCSTRVITEIIEDKKFVRQLQFLFFIEEISFNKKGNINLFCCADFNLSEKFVSFKFNHNLIEDLDNKTKTLDNLVNKLQNEYDIFNKLMIRITTHNETVIRRTIQNLFVELSDQAEKLLQNQVEPSVNEKIKDFLSETNIPQTADYHKQIISVIYQHVSKTFQDTLFQDGWAFRFVFKEGDNTRASSSNDDFKPIYSKQVYWNLKELMFKSKGTDFIEAGLLWNTKDGISPVAVKIEQKNNFLIVQYYRRSYNLHRRREKEHYVLRKIREGFQGK
ncbi:hypothetical protein M3685_02345 [Heyndrickxia oleronia]|uniref:hypothetical protein n=1 Tax=Heyndrickxia oleronia TaxID=38875 RepID=UPI002041BD0D|nr:hypothetical protein [Heyndrickxia oleronia]MCM3452787.1 hypothetical protein [Heyndrickxia oleronia]